MPASYSQTRCEVHRNSVHRPLLEELEFVGEDAAVLRYCEVLTGDERAPDKVVRSRKVLVVTRCSGDWKIAWGQNTRLPARRQRHYVRP